MKKTLWIIVAITLLCVTLAQAQTFRVKDKSDDPAITGTEAIWEDSQTKGVHGLRLNTLRTWIWYGGTLTTLGDMFYWGTTVPVRLPGNTTSAREFLISQGTGSAAQAPAYGPLIAADIPDNSANTSGNADTATTAGALSSSGFGSSTPNMDGTGAAGSALTAAHSDHVHPSDTSRQAALGGLTTAGTTLIAKGAGIDPVNATDSTAAINALIAGLTSNTSRVLDVYLPDGTYYTGGSSSAACTANGVPWACCTGSGTGSCTSGAGCTGSGTPWACCTGTNTGTCGISATGKNVRIRGNGPNSARIIVTGNYPGIDIDGTGVTSAQCGVSGLGVASGNYTASTLIRIQNSETVFLNNLWLSGYGIGLDLGSGINYSLLSNIRGEFYGGGALTATSCGSAIINRKSGGDWTNVHLRKASNVWGGAGVGNAGPTVWLKGAGSLQVSASDFAGTGSANIVAITGITSNASTFTVAVAAGHGFVANEWCFIRGTSTNYDGSWWITSVGSTSIVVTTAANPGTFSGAGATIEFPSACLYADASATTVNETQWDTVLFEGMDAWGSAGDPGTVSILFNAMHGTKAIHSNRFANCMLDVGQVGAMLESYDVSPGAYDFLISNFELNGGTVRYATRALYAQQVSDVKWVPGTTNANMDKVCNNTECTDVTIPYAYCTGYHTGTCHGGIYDVLSSSDVWINGGGSMENSRGIWLSGYPLGRGPDWRLDTYSMATRTPNYGLRLTQTTTSPAVQDLDMNDLHVWGIVAPVLVDNVINPVATPTAIALAPATRIMENRNCQYGSGVTGESDATRIPTIASNTTIAIPFGDIFHISGVTAVATMTGAWAGRKITLIADSGFATTTAGNISVVKTLTAGQACDFVYDNASSKWYPVM